MRRLCPQGSFNQSKIGRGPYALSVALAFQDQMDQAIAMLKEHSQSIPNYTLAAVNLAQWLVYAGRYAEA